MESIADVLKRRDGMSEVEAQTYIDSAREEIQTMIDEGASYDDIEDAFTFSFGLELGYFFDLFM